MRVQFSLVALGLVLLICDSCTESSNKPKVEEPSKRVELELVIPQKLLYLDCQDNEISVILRNTTDSSLTVYYKDNKRNNSYLSFEIKTADSSYIITQKENGWAHNISWNEKIESTESFIFPCNLMAYTCYFSGKEKPLIREDYNGWVGLPNKTYDSALIKVIYEAKDLADSTLGNCPGKIESRFYKIRVDKSGSSYIPFKRIIDIK